MARILIVDDDAALRESLAETVRDLGHEARLATSGAEALDVIGKERFAGILLDLRMPGGVDGIEVLRRLRSRGKAPPVIVLTAFASAANTIEAMRLGALDHLTKPIGRHELAALLERLAAEPGPAMKIDPQDGGDLVGSSEAMRHVHKTIGIAADSDTTVLVLGETGTGKELVARALHEHGQRRPKPFVAVNCAAIPNELLESELFGHVRGAFTGATTDRVGAFREADGGTLFLDEIGDMAPTMQAKILRALQDRMVTPVGGKPTKVNARVIAATHRDLIGMVARGEFRDDLFYRLNVVPIVLPPLRERRMDVVPLAHHFLAQVSQPPKRLTERAATLLTEHAWPGNVRELRNVIARACLLVRGDIIDTADLSIPPIAEPSAQEDLRESDLPAAVAKFESDMILKALASCGGNRAEAARQLGIHRQLLYAKMLRYGLGTESASGMTTSGVGKTDG